MQIWKFLLLGITGDLAKKKILAGLAQFAQQNEENVHVHLIGYSRSEAKQNSIEAIVNQASNGHHSLASISYLQGEYTDLNLLSNLQSELKDGERLVVYLAVPPSIFVPFLQNVKVDKQDQLDIIMEKPFGQNMSEAQEMIDTITTKQLENVVHFCDHYTFKTSSHLTRAELSNLKDIKDKTLTSIVVQALEAVDVKGRGGYYDSNGAIKDMLPAHLYSLLNLGLGVHQKPTSDEFATWKTTKLELGQYASYQKDVEIEESKTESYFKIEGELTQEQNIVRVSLESGKSLGLKQTQIELNFSDGTQIVWNVDPGKILSLNSPENSLTLNLDKSNTLDHTNMFNQVLESNFERFLQPQDVLQGWQLYDKINEFRTTTKPTLTIYRTGFWPIVERD